MKRFKFELERVLELRAYREQEAKIELGRAVAVLSALEQRLRDLAAERVKAAGERFSPENRTADLVVFERYIRRLDDTREKLLAEAARAELRVAEAREAFLEASREKKTLEKLRDRRLGEYRREFFAEEIKVLDDVSGGMAARESAGD